MNQIFQFPSNAYFGKMIPKSKIYLESKATSRIKNFFIRDVDKISWEYKLAPETINMSATNSVSEIQVVRLVLRNEEFSDEILQAIDKTIPSHLIFQIEFEDKIQYAIALKRQNMIEQDKSIISSHFKSDWIKADANKVNLPALFNLENLYHHFINELIPIAGRKNETVREMVERFESIKSKKREAEKLAASLKKVKQFNRKVELNKQINCLKLEIETLNR